MAWEKRGNRNYFYRKRRVKGKVESEYVGGGEIAGFIAERERLEKQINNVAAERLKQRRIEADALDDQINELSELNQMLVDALFLMNGYHRHKRQWRKIRKRTTL